MFEEALGYLENLEHVCVDALELMLRRHLAGQLQKPYAILNVNYQMMLPPLPVEEGHASELCYCITFLDKHYDLCTFQLSDIRNSLMHIVISIYGNNQLIINTQLDGHTNQIIKKGQIDYNLNRRITKDAELFDCSSLDSKIIGTAMGVGIRKVDDKGTLTIDNKCFVFDNLYAKRYTLFFFDRGKFCFFDDEGILMRYKEDTAHKLSAPNDILSILSPPQKNRHLTARKAARIKKVSKCYSAFDPVSNTKKAEEYMLNNWLMHPEWFDCFGRRLLVQGKASEVTEVNGHFKFKHRMVYGKRVRDKNTFFVEFDTSKEPEEQRQFVYIEWRGSYTIISDTNGKTLNAWSLPTPGIDTGQPQLVDRLDEVIYIKNLNQNAKRQKFVVNCQRYEIAPTQIANALSILPKCAPKAIYAYINTQTGENSVKMIASHGGKIYSADLKPSRPYKKR